MSSIRPSADQYAAFYTRYVELVPVGANPLDQLRSQPAQLHALLDSLSEEQAATAYAPGKWTIKELLLHMVDAERVFGYRAMRFARADAQPLAGFDENAYAAASGANTRSLQSLLAEYDAVRAASLALFGSFTEAQLDQWGTANGNPVSVRALLYILPGHELHHLGILRERYLPVLETVS